MWKCELDSAGWRQGPMGVFVNMVMSIQVCYHKKQEISWPNKKYQVFKKHPVEQGFSTF
jgi:hypothetical protein